MSEAAGDDLNGLDVARKVVIAARESGVRPCPLAVFGSAPRASSSSTSAACATNRTREPPPSFDTPRGGAQAGRVPAVWARRAYCAARACAPRRGCARCGGGGCGGGGGYGGGGGAVTVTVDVSDESTGGDWMGSAQALFHLKLSLWQ